MDIIWNPNPLKTRVEIDDRDRQMMRLKIENNFLFGRLYDAYTNVGRYSIETLETDMEAHVDRMLSYAEKCLRSDEQHCGDCTCVPASCGKCRAEGYLGIDTIEGLGKHEAGYISRSFIGGRTIEKALDYLENYEVGAETRETFITQHKYTEEQFAALAESWKKQADRAYEWLKNYGEEHGFR